MLYPQPHVHTYRGVAQRTTSEDPSSSLGSAFEISSSDPSKSFNLGQVFICHVPNGIMVFLSHNAVMKVLEHRVCGQVYGEKKTNNFSMQICGTKTSTRETVYWEIWERLSMLWFSFLFSKIVIIPFMLFLICCSLLDNILFC